MMRASFTLMLTLLLLAAGALWLLGELDTQKAAQRALPRLRTVDLQELREQVQGAAAVLGVARTAAGPRAEEPDPARVPPRLDPDPAGQLEDVRLPDPKPHVEAPLPDAEPEAAEDRDAPLVVATRDQDAWAQLIRRMLALHRRAGGS